MITEAKSLSEIEGQLTQTIAVGTGSWWSDRETAKTDQTDMGWIEASQREKLEEIMDWCFEKYPKQWDAIISEHIQDNETNHYKFKFRKWFDVRLSFTDPNAALEFKLVWG